jgi:WhiB family redox-sensing transcriptional regulator
MFSLWQHQKQAKCRNNLLHALTAEEKLVRLAAHIDRELDNMDWRHKAVCRDEDPELFFPVGNSGPAIAQIADAKLVCNRCPVTTECLTWALDSGQDAGVWGGMSEDERRALKRRNARTKARTGV